ncbi:mitogen-activated protein kinase kinase kinase 18 [Brachypodium distachyon]|nr:mitogen-activated protein kinase kinase kinase 18 [Brachypodium distachyon]|eukprot:XP_003567028.1 mitogen-activated protein kinase kinase kinase 18 [Brachypodium distachyon]
MAIAVSGHWTRLRTLGCGASGAVVSLATDAASGELFAVKSVRGAADADLLSREQGILSGLSSPHIVRCIGGLGEDRDGSYHLFLEFAPGGSLADEVARNGGFLEEHAIRAYAADVLRGLAYIHGESLVHGDVKARNVVIGVDGRAKIADFGCARALDSTRPIGGTPAFMAPEVARGEEQGPAADVWALGCTIIEMATGRAPWSDMDDVLAAVHRIGYTDAVPEVPMWMSAEAKNFLAMCFARNARDRCTAEQLLEHPFVAVQAGEAKAARWVSPKSTLDAAFWESETDGEEEEDEISSQSSSERIKSLSCPVSALPDWDSDEGWIDVLGDQHDEACDSPATKEEADVACRTPSKVSGSATVPAEDMVVVGSFSSDELEAEDDPFDDGILAVHPAIVRQDEACSSSGRDVLSFQIPCNRINAIKKVRFPQFLLCRPDKVSSVHTLRWSHSGNFVLRTEFISVSGEKGMSVSHTKDPTTTITAAVIYCSK